jgi:hypothetical protein
MKRIEFEQLKNASTQIPALIGHCFEIKKMVVEGISNDALLAKNGHKQHLEEYLVMSRNVNTGSEYLSAAMDRILESIRARRPLPIVRFADGEYEFYNLTMKCNGLYQQARSVEEIKQSIPMHVSSLKYVTQNGMIAPLLFPGNLVKSKSWNPFGKIQGNIQGKSFLEFLLAENIKITNENYLPFYAVYALLTSEVFSRSMNGKKVCIVNSDYEENECNDWFRRRRSQPNLCSVEIPASYIATEWETMRANVLKQIPEGVDLFLVGAGIGALLVCKDLAQNYSVPAIDAGHVLNMMNGKVRKSNGDRLYTFSEPVSISPL